MDSRWSRSAQVRRGVRELSSTGPIAMWVLASQLQTPTTLQEFRPRVSAVDGQCICHFCQPWVESSEWAQQVGNARETEDKIRIVYRDWAQLDSLAEQGCSTCKVFRAHILYDHPSPDALELLALDQESIVVRVNEENETVVGLTISYPCKRSKFDLGDFMPNPNPDFFSSGASGNVMVPVPNDAAAPSGYLPRTFEEDTSITAGLDTETASDQLSDPTTRDNLSVLLPPQHAPPSKASAHESYDSHGKPIPSYICKWSSIKSINVHLHDVSGGVGSTSSPSLPRQALQLSAGDDSSSDAMVSSTTSEGHTHILKTILGDSLPLYEHMIDQGDTVTIQERPGEFVKAFGDDHGPERWAFANNINHLTISSTSSDILVIRKLIMWIGTCIASHPQCGLLRHQSHMPARLIDLGDRQLPFDNVRVIETKGVRMSYSCLSYCWGGDSLNHCKLLRSNLQQFQEAISTDGIPKTVRDAMWISKAIGVRYIWVDALCIIQDDALDWRAQAPWMGQFYENAVVTIAASSSEHANMGMLRPRVAESYKLEPCKIFNKCPDRPLPHTRGHWAGAPINQRAWTMQELYLSRRTIHMTDASVAWECRTHKGLEYCPMNDASPMFPHSNTRQAFRLEISDAKTMYNAWQNLVIEYSSKGMTKPDDILVAVSSLADIVRVCTQDVYLAGLWKQNLLYDLMWQTDESRSRSENYTAPSWSWASTHGSGGESISFVNHRLGKAVVEIDEASVNYLDSNPRSRALSGYLRVTGKIAEAKVTFDHYWAAHGGEGFIITVKAFNKATGDLTFDDRAMVTTNCSGFRTRTTDTQLYCLAMTERDPEQGTRESRDGFMMGWLTVLILEKIEGCYRRVGFAILDGGPKDAGTFETWEKECITIL